MKNDIEKMLIADIEHLLIEIESTIRQGQISQDTRVIAQGLLLNAAILHSLNKNIEEFFLV